MLLTGVSSIRAVAPSSPKLRQISMHEYAEALTRGSRNCLPPGPDRRGERVAARAALRRTRRQTAHGGAQEGDRIGRRLLQIVNDLLHQLAFVRRGVVRAPAVVVGRQG